MSQQFKLPDGRNVDYLVAGAKDGFPLVWIHGTPSALTPLPNINALCEKKGVKLVTFSRAGYGGSTRHKGRRAVDAVADTQALLKHLNIEQCFVGGWSGGGPHVLACAARLSGCVAALCVAGVGPYDADDLDFLAGQGEDNVQETKAALQGEEECQKFCEAQRSGLLDADVAGVIEEMSTILPEVDKKALLENDWMGQYVVESFKVGLKDNCDGWVDDNLVFVNPWGFDLAEIKVPVLLYQGSEDLMVPYSHGEWLAKHLPQEYLQKHLMQDQGHISIFLGQAEAMIDGLLAARKS